VPAGNYEWPRSATLPSVGGQPAGFANEAPAWLRNDLWPDEYNRCLKPYVSAIDQIVDRLAREEYSNFRQRIVLGFDPANINERSKPVGLTKEHSYTDNDGDKLTVEENPDDDLAIAWVSHLSENGFNVTAENSVPLALNILGYDRPSSAPYVAGPTTYNGRTANRSIPTSKSTRDAHVAEAIDLLIGADIFDQREVERKEFEAKAAAKRDAEYAKHKQESFDHAKQSYADAIRDQIASGIDAESAAKVQAALSAYETARRKLEGLPS
jgi:hypothetical protein